MEKRRFRVFAALVLCLSLIAAACGGGGGGGSATLVSIAVTPANPSIATGATRQFTATGTYSDSSTKDITASVTWASSDHTRATVSASGLATAASNAAGSATITATSGGVSGNAVLKVIVNLPKTGQITSYGTGTSDDGALQRGVAWPNPRFTANADTAVTDNLTGLVWAPNGNVMPTRDNNWDQDGTVNDGAVTWQHALDYVAKLNAESYLGHTDWRLPNRKELRSLVNYGQANVAAWLNTQGFSNVQADVYWSSGTYAADTTYACVVSMSVGSVGAFVKASVLYVSYVWPVRDAAITATISLPKTGQVTSYGTGTIDDGGLQKGVAWPSPRFTAGTGAEVDCVTDNLTGLMWVKAPDSTTRTWQAALDHADGLDLCGHTDWRLPNLNELESLVHAEYTNATLCGGGCISNAAWLNTQGFSNVQEDFYWSSGTYAADTLYAWIVEMPDGVVSASSKTLSHYVWPVRSGQ